MVKLRRGGCLAVYSDNPRFAATVLPEAVARRLEPVEAPEGGIRPVLDKVFPGGSVLYAAPWDGDPWADGALELLVTEHSARSQYDQLIELARARVPLPSGVACLAGSGTDFHGFKGRPWAAVPGNLHLSVHLAPNRPVERFGVAFTALAAVSVVEAIAGVDGLAAPPRIKWVNDILMGNAKVAGILAYTQSRDTTVTSAVLGLGVNVEQTPRVSPTPFVPEVASVSDFLPSTPAALRRRVLLGLLEALRGNYGSLLSEGPAHLLERYRGHSLVLGREVTVCTEGSDHTLQFVAHGRVEGLGENLELTLSGRAAPVTGGRLVLGRVETEIPKGSREAGNPESTHERRVPVLTPELHSPPPGAGMHWSET